MRLRLTIAYDGTPFRGWQSQPGGNTVQDHLEAAIARILTDAPPVRVHGSGRTDTGVHALGQTAHCDIPDTCRMDTAAWRRALNVHLPPAIRVMDVAVAPPDFHARFDAVGKTYRYHLWNDEVLPPHLHRRAWHVPGRLDIGCLAETVSRFLGRHDFAGFAAFRGDARQDADTVRTLHDVLLTADGPDIRLTWHGDGFLYRMVRLLTGSAVRVASGRDQLAWLLRLLDRSDRGKSHHLAPADGLWLVSVDYGGGV